MMKIGHHAIVIGASISGLLAARVLGDFYDTVTVVERDALADDDAPRKGIPQARHAHGLLAKGSSTLEELFPGFTEDVVAAGGSVGDILKNATWANHGCALHDEACGLQGILVSRPMLESLIRRRVIQLLNVRLQPSTDVSAPIYDATHSRVTGLTTHPAGRPDGETSILADLVVDASGRGARSASWLASWGYRKPSEEIVRVDINYKTQHFRRRPEHLPGRNGAIISACAPHWRGGALLGQENDRWIVSLGGYFGDRAPDDDAGFRAFAKSLQRPEIYDVIKDAEPLDGPASYNFPSSIRRRFENLTRFPGGFLVFGDAVCSFNPIYGQGMSAAAAQALALRQCLAGGLEGLSRRYFSAISKVIDAPWQITVGADLGHPKVDGPRPTSVRFINWYIAKLFEAGSIDPFVAKRFIEVVNLVRPPADLMSPAVAWRVWRAHKSASLGPAVRASAQSA